MSNTEYLSVTQYAEKIGLKVARVRQMAADGLLSATKVGSQWIIPADTPKPPDNRVKSGKYKGWRKGGAANAKAGV